MSASATCPCSVIPGRSVPSGGLAPLHPIEPGRAGAASVGGGRWSRQLSSRGGRHGVHSVAGSRRAASVTGDDVHVPPRRVAGQQGLRYPPDPPTVEEIVAVMRAAGDCPEGVRLRGVIIVLWRAGLRISEALALNETDLNPERGARLVRQGKGDKRREVGVRTAGCGRTSRHGCSCGAVCRSVELFGVVRGPTRGRPCAPAVGRKQLHDTAVAAGLRRRFAPHQLRHAHAVEMSREVSCV